MVYKTKFLKDLVTNNYDPAADGIYEVELTDNPLAAVWITVKGDLVQAGVCIDDMMASLTSLDFFMGGFNIAHYTTPLKALVMNCKLKGAWPYLVNSSQTIDDVVGVTFPVLFGAPYLNDKMCLPQDTDNRKYLQLGLDIATAYVDDLLIDICQVIMPDANPLGFIRQQEYTVAAPGAGEHDINLQRNWDLLKLLFYSTTTPTGTAYTSTIERAGLEIDDFAFGYRNVPWEIMHGELMDELEGSGPVEDHIHADPSSGNTGMPVDLEHWICKYGQFDFFYNYDLKWRAPLKGCSSAKVKYTCGVDEAFGYVLAEYCPVAGLK